ncbi:hypothetical protein QE372_005224 [Agrobacterium pusense]|uniref:hypothetical protein n=1 Tax=Agrobacterium pusense TaxID=648995 RepID=UPI00285EF606|nr:hypothetical protein [Agrobacterium pusense]MDR6192890.1 hypothetical protein [Agrobacterium pusense]
MIEEIPSELLAEIIRFLTRNLPGNAKGWHHDFISGHQMGCQALVRLAEATETPWGAVPRVPVIPPTPLPRLDDLVVTVLNVAGQKKSVFRLLPRQRGWIGLNCATFRYIRNRKMPFQSPPPIISVKPLRRQR